MFEKCKECGSRLCVSPYLRGAIFGLLILLLIYFSSFVLTGLSVNPGHQEILKASVNWVSDFLTPVVTTVLTGLFTLVGVFLGFSWQKQNQSKQEKEFVTNLVKSLKAEATVIFKLYMESAESHIEDAHMKNGYFNAYYPITQSYFVFYERNTQHISRIESSPLVKALIEWYVYGQSLIDTFKANNDLLEKLDSIQEQQNHWNSFGDVNSAGALQLELLRQNYVASAIKYCSSLYQAHIAFKEKMNALNLEIDAFLDD